MARIFAFLWHAPSTRQRKALKQTLAADDPASAPAAFSNRSDTLELVWVIFGIPRLPTKTW